MKSCKLIFLIVCWTYAISLTAQDREQLEQERMQVIKSIEATDELIASSETDRQKRLATLVALRGQIDQRNSLLSNIKKSISAAELEIEYNVTILDSLTHRIKSIETQYATVLQSKYVRKLTGNRWITILSSSNINEAFLRWNYYRQFDTYRQSKLDELVSIEKAITLKNEEIKNYALKNSELIQEQQRQNSELQTRIEQQNELLKNLQKDKAILQSQLSVIKEARETLNKAIESRVLGELSGAKIGSDNDSKGNDTNPVIVKGKVIQPITNGYIEDFSVEDQGKTKTLSIMVAKDASVISIAPGKVVSVIEVDGYGKMVILQHEEYYSIYANMNVVTVKEGDKVKVKSKLGTIDSNVNKLHFELWKEKIRLDANEWIVK